MFLQFKVKILFVIVVNLSCLFMIFSILTSICSIYHMDATQHGDAKHHVDTTHHRCAKYHVDTTHHRCAKYYMDTTHHSDAKYYMDTTHHSDAKYHVDTISHRYNMEKQYTSP